MALSDSLFVSETLHERTVELQDGTKHVLHFRELPSVAFRAFHLAEQSQDEEIRAGSMARLIASSLCNPDGTPALDYERARKLKPEPANAMVREILAINGVAAGAKKPSPPAESSGSGTS